MPTGIDRTAHARGLRNRSVVDGQLGLRCAGERKLDPRQPGRQSFDLLGRVFTRSVERDRRAGRNPFAEDAVIALVRFDELAARGLGASQSEQQCRRMNQRVGAGE